MRMFDCLLAAALAVLLPSLACGQDAAPAAPDAAAPADAPAAKTDAPAADSPATDSPATDAPAAAAPVEGAAPPAAAATEAPAADAAADAKFNEVFGRWKELLKQIRTLQVEYQSADEAGRTALEKQFGQLVGEARGLVPDVVSAAEASYRAAPGANKEVTNFLGSVLTDYLVNDNYEPALPLAELLIEGSSDLPKLYMVAGTAAFVTHNYDKARTYLQKAREKGDLDPPAGGGNQVEQRIVQLAAMYAESIDRYDELWKAEQEIRAAEAKADDLPRIKLETSKGPVIVELFENEAPQAAANFLTLVEEGYYDGLSFHRVIGGFMAQGGCPRGDGTGGPGYHIACECHGKDFRRHFRGTLSMAHAGRDTGGSQFFLTFVPTSHLDGKHTAFGRVIEGMEVLAKLNRSEPATGLPPDKIVKATVVRKREHPYEFEKLPATR